MKILLKRNHRLFNFEQEFGKTLAFLPTLLVDAGFLDKQNAGAVDCTCFTVDKVKSGETGKKYDHAWLWAQMVAAGKVSASGAVPTDAFSLAVKKQKVLDKEEYDDSVAYFQVDEGSYDFFTNVKSAIQILHDKGLKRPVGCGTYWYWEYLQTGPNQTVKEGKTVATAHEWVVCGWDEEHPDCFKIDAHEGFYRYITRDEFNKVMDATYGSVALTLAETTEEKISFLKETNYSRIQAIIDLIYNAVKILQARISLFKQQPNPINTLPPVLDPDLGPVIHPILEPKFNWSDKDINRHNVSVICDEEGLSVTDKRDLCATVGAESGWKADAIGKTNKDGSRDYGIVQVNDKYWIGPGKLFPSTEYVLNNPEKCIRWMCREWKKGNKNWWYGFKSGNYKKYL